MRMQQSFSVLAIACGMALTGCGGSSGGDDTSALNASGGPITPTAPAGPNGTFFNDIDGVNFASTLGGGLSSVAERAIDSSTRAFSSAAVDDNPASGVFNDETSVESCDSGSISYSVATDANNELTNASIVFNNCVVGGQTSTGTMSFSSSSSSNSETLNVSFSDFATRGPEGDSSIDGDVSMEFGENGSGSISGSQLTLVTDGETTTFSNFGLHGALNDTTGESSVSGQAVIASSTDGTIQFNIDPALTGPADGNPTVGQLSLMHSDGSSLTIDANTGNPDTYSYTIFGNGSTSSGVGNWDDEDIAISAFASRSIGR